VGGPEKREDGKGRDGCGMLYGKILEIIGKKMLEAARTSNGEKVGGLRERRSDCGGYKEGWFFFPQRQLQKGATTRSQITRGKKECKRYLFRKSIRKRLWENSSCAIRGETEGGKVRGRKKQ